MSDLDSWWTAESDPHETVANARDRLFMHRDDPQGVSCPCCDRLVKRYKRGITSTTALFVLRLAKIHKSSSNEEWIDIGSFNVRGGDYAKATYWNLAKSMPNSNNATRCSGWWKVTEDGIAFVERRLKIPQYALVYAGKVEGHCGTLVDIVDVLGSQFNYAKLMQQGANRET